MLGRAGGDATRLQRRPRPVQEAEPRQEGEHRRHHVPDAREVLEQPGGADQGEDRAARLREEEDRAAAESHVAQVLGFRT